MKSDSIYSLVTEQWPKIAAGMVAGGGILEFGITSFTSDTTLEWYLLAWGSLTAGLWFLFDIAERATTTESRNQLAQWIKQSDLEPGLASIPQRFASFFDHVFGEKHFSFFCFRRSTMASIIAAWIVSVTAFSVNPLLFTSDYSGSLQDPVLDPTVINIGMLGLLALLFNIIPDYLSLLQTRFMLKWLKGGVQTFLVLLVDIFSTGFIFIAYVVGLSTFLLLLLFYLDERNFDFLADPRLMEILSDSYRSIVNESFFRELSEPGFGANLGLLFITTFFTSIWLWLYIVASWLSQILLRLNNGVGFLLKVVDVEQQPLRSIGFVSILLVSFFFILGLPLVIW